MRENISPEDKSFLDKIRGFEVGAFAVSAASLVAIEVTDKAGFIVPAVSGFALGLVLDGAHRAKEIRSIPRPAKSTNDFTVIKGKINE